MFSNYFDSNIFFLKFSALWIYDQGATKWEMLLQTVYNVFWWIYLYFVYFPTESMYLYVVYRDLKGIVRTLRDMGNHIILIIKAVNWFYMRKDIIKLMEILKHDRFQYEEHDGFSPMGIMTSHKNTARKWTNILFNLINAICATMMVSSTYLFIFEAESHYVEENGKLVYRQTMPVNVISPFGNETRVQFFLTLVYTVVALTFYGWMISSLDSLFVTLMSCVSAQLMILEGALRTIRPRCMRRLGLKLKEFESSSNLQLEMEKEMRKCCIHLQTLLKTSGKLEGIYHTQILLQTMFSLMEICFCLYLLSLALDSSTGNELTYLFSTGFQLLFYCWFGNMVTEASGKVRYAFYETDWLFASLKFKKEMLFTMKRMDRPIYITIGKITPLSFSTFLTIVRGAYSFFTFLKHGTSD